jgi:hypothetical protein
LGSGGGEGESHGRVHTASEIRARAERHTGSKERRQGITWNATNATRADVHKF